MIHDKFINEQLILLNQEASDWQDAIKSMRPLIKRRENKRDLY